MAIGDFLKNVGSTVKGWFSKDDDKTLNDVVASTPQPLQIDSNTKISTDLSQIPKAPLVANTPAPVETPQINTGVGDVTNGSGVSLIDFANEKEKEQKPLWAPATFIGKVAKGIVNFITDPDGDDALETPRTKGEVDSKAIVNDELKQLNMEKRSDSNWFNKGLGALTNILGVQQVGKGGNMTSATILGGNLMEDAIQSELSPRLKNIYNIVDDKYAKQDLGEDGDKLYGSMVSPISSPEMKTATNALATSILQSEDPKVFKQVISYFDDPDKFGETYNAEQMKTNIADYKNQLGMKDISDEIFYDIVKESLNRRDDYQTKIAGHEARETKIQEAYKAYDPVGYSEYMAKNEDWESFKKSQEEQLQQRILQSYQKRGMAHINKETGLLEPSTTEAINGATQQLDALATQTQKFGALMGQAGSAASLAKSQGINVDEDYKIIDANTKQYFQNLQSYYQILNDVSERMPDASDRELHREVSKEIEKVMGYKTVNGLMTHNMIGLNGEPIGAGGTWLTAQDFITNQIRTMDAKIRIAQPISVASLWALSNDVISQPVTLLAGSIGKWAENGTVPFVRDALINEEARADLAVMSGVNPSGHTKSVWDLWYSSWNKLGGAVPEVGANIGATLTVGGLLGGLGRAAGLVSEIRAAGITRNVLANIGRVGLRSIPENILQNSIIYSADTGINTPDQFAADVVGTVLGVGFDVAVDVAPTLVRYAKNTDAINAVLEDRKLGNAIMSAAEEIKKTNPNMSDAELLNAAKQQANANGLAETAKTGKARITTDEVKQISKDMKNIQADYMKKRATMPPAERDNLDTIMKQGYGQARVWHDIITKPSISDVDIMKYSQIMSAAGDRSVAMADFIRAVNKVVPETRQQMIGMLQDMSKNKNMDNTVAQLRFNYTNPQEMSYIQKTVQKLAPEATYTLDDMADMQRILRDETSNPLKIQQDLFVREGDGYKYFRQTESGDYVLNSEGFKQLGIIDNRGRTAVAEKVVGGENFYKAVEESNVGGIDETTLDRMRRANTFEQVYETVESTIPC